MTIEGAFRNWSIGMHTASCGPHQLWICNGFICFSDFEANERFLWGLSLWQRWKVWRELKAEVGRRSLAAMASAIGA